MSRDAKSSYYDAGGIETLDIIKAKLTPEQYEGYLLGNALKYQSRMMHKSKDPAGQARDAEKASNYTVWLLEVLAAKEKEEEARRFPQPPSAANIQHTPNPRTTAHHLAVDNATRDA